MGLLGLLLLAGCSGGGGGLQITITPDTVTVAPTLTQKFTATVRGAGVSTVTWSITETDAGAIVDGLYTAPRQTGTYHVVATSTADPTKSATATVEVAYTSITELGESSIDLTKQLAIYTPSLILADKLRDGDVYAEIDNTVTTGPSIPFAVFRANLTTSPATWELDFSSATTSDIYHYAPAGNYSGAFTLKVFVVAPGSMPKQVGVSQPITLNFVKSDGPPGGA